MFISSGGASGGQSEYANIGIIHEIFNIPLSGDLATELNVVTLFEAVSGLHVIDQLYDSSGTGKRKIRITSNDVVMFDGIELIETGGNIEIDTFTLGKGGVYDALMFNGSLKIEVASNQDDRDVYLAVRTLEKI